MHPAMDQRDWERRARSKYRAGPRARGPWRHPHALWLAVIVAVVVLLQGATYARIHARSSRIQSADEEIARRAETRQQRRDERVTADTAAARRATSGAAAARAPARRAPPRRGRAPAANANARGGAAHTRARGRAVTSLLFSLSL